ncbi:MAG: ABC transporter permease [Clostridia bacterium]|nr:ABC transporter permease [Clostridia bacterium]
MLLSLAKNDFKAKYAGSALGTIWAFINPVITVLIYWFVFQVAFGNGDVGDVPYVLWLVSGIIPWFFISESWGGATGVFTDYSYLVKKVVFPVEILPMVRIISAFGVHLFFVLLTFIVSIACGVFPHFIHIQILYYMVCAFAISYALGQICAVLNAFLKDTANIVGVIVQMGFWITPIFWNIADIPQSLTFIFKLNPIFYVVQGYRDTFAFGIYFWERWRLLIYFWAITLVLLFIGRILFKRTRPHFADLL